MLNKIDHVGIAVKSVDQVIAFYRDTFGLEPEFDEIVEEQRVRAVGFRLGESKIEFLEATDETSPIARYISKKGEGMHHIAYGVDNIDAVLSAMKNNGARLIDEEARIGAEGKLIAFVHPKSMNGMLVELSQDAPE